MAARSPDQNVGCVLKEPKVFEVRDIPTAKPGPTEVRLAINFCGICGSDLHFYAHGTLDLEGYYRLNGEIVMGHECSATVVELGSQVTTLNVGDRVAIEPNVPCRKCRFCKEGRYNLCPDEMFFATPPATYGGLQRWLCLEQDFCFPIPDHVSDEEAALLEPVNVALMHFQRAGVKRGDRLLVLGAGPVGLMMCLVAKAVGVVATAITDFNQTRLDFGSSHCKIDHALNITGLSRDATVNALMTTIGLVDVVVDTSGQESAQNVAITMLRPGGVLQLCGYHKLQNRLHIIDVICKEIEIRAAFRYANCYPAAVDLLAARLVDVKPFISHTFQIDDVVDAFECALNPMKSGAIKVVIQCNRR